MAHPLVATRWEETHLVVPDAGRIDIGLAVDAGGGLVVPVIRDVGRSSLEEVARRSRELVAAARAGRLTAADMHGGVFTLTSLGSYGVEFFAPVINWPQAAILGLGTIRAVPTPAAGTASGVAFRDQLPLSLTFDHRIVDGGPAARFLHDLAARIAGCTPRVIVPAPFVSPSAALPIGCCGDAFKGPRVEGAACSGQATGRWMGRLLVDGR